MDITFFRDTKKVCTVVKIPGRAFRIKIVASTRIQKRKLVNNDNVKKYIT